MFGFSRKERGLKEFNKTASAYQDALNAHRRNQTLFWSRFTQNEDMSPEEMEARRSASDRVDEIKKTLYKQGYALDLSYSQILDIIYPKPKPESESKPKHRRPFGFGRFRRR